jgi:hypothetical protein
LSVQVKVLVRQHLRCRKINGEIERRVLADHCLSSVAAVNPFSSCICQGMRMDRMDYFYRFRTGLITFFHISRRRGTGCGGGRANDIRWCGLGCRVPAASAGSADCHRADGYGECDVT